MRAKASALSRLVARLLVGAILVYRYTLSPWLGPRCRFLPSCSAYALEAVQRHGAWRGGWLAVKRLCRCHPWGGSGHDPVP
ncbi:MAG TPA: membrane protein insertion efficiency factor YidD [Gammaproteobacteria bacterium]|nr:membrane protein insertion efficiency factor YidD [Gammaproteobacteria bacterium]